MWFPPPSLVSLYCALFGHHSGIYALCFALLLLYILFVVLCINILMNDKKVRDLPPLGVIILWFNRSNCVAVKHSKAEHGTIQSFKLSTCIITKYICLLDDSSTTLNPHEACTDTHTHHARTQEYTTNGIWQAAAGRTGNMLFHLFVGIFNV